MTLSFVLVPATIVVLAPPDATWPRELLASLGTARPPAITSTSSVPELECRIRSGARWDAAVIDGRVAGADRELISRLRSSGAGMVVVIDHARRHRAWLSCGADRVVEDPTAAAAALLRPPPTRTTARPVAHPRGPLIAVIGQPGASGAETVPVTVAEALARGHPGRVPVVLADLARTARHGAVHGLDPQHRGLTDLLDERRAGPASSPALAATVPVAHRRYRILPGLRHPADWISVRPAALHALLDELGASSAGVVAAIEPDLEGEARTGSFDIEDRNCLARTLAVRADLVVITCEASTAGRRSTSTLLQDLADLGVPRPRTLLVVVRPPAGRRHGVAAATKDIFGDAADLGDGLAAPVVLPHLRAAAQAVAVGRRLPRPVVAAVAGALEAALIRAEATPPPTSGPTAPVRVLPGELGHWTA